MTRQIRCTHFAFIMAACLPAALMAAAPKLPAGTTVLDPDIYMYSWPYPRISPDGKWVAYVSQGYVSVCNLAAPKPLRVKEVPNSWTWPHLKAPAGHTPATGHFEALSQGLTRDEYNELHSRISNTIHGLNWTHDSSGFVFGVQAYDKRRHAPICEVFLATIEGKVTRLVQTDSDSPTRTVNSGMLTRDGRYLVATERQLAHPDYRPLIWNVKTNRPKATPFLTLVPSSTSGRWIGIEKDTRQLVLLDEAFRVMRRFEEFLPDRTFGFQLDWSPDERSIVWRNQIGFDHYSNWEGFWLDLESGEKRLLEGRFRDELILFTGDGGEFVRFGRDGVRSKFMSGDNVTGAHLTIVPSGGGRPRDVWRIHTGSDDQNTRVIRNIPAHPMLHMAGKGKLFAIPLATYANERYQLTWHLMDRAGKSCRVPGEDRGEYVTPFALAGFAGGGKLLVAYDKTRLFTIPVSSIVKGENAVEKE